MDEGHWAPPPAQLVPMSVKLVDAPTQSIEIALIWSSQDGDMIAESVNAAMGLAAVVRLTLYVNLLLRI